MRTLLFCLAAISLLAPSSSIGANNAESPKSKVLVSDGSPVPWPTKPPTGLSKGTLMADASPVPWPTGGGGGKDI